MDIRAIVLCILRIWTRDDLEAVLQFGGVAVESLHDLVVFALASLSWKYKVWV